MMVTEPLCDADRLGLTLVRRPCPVCGSEADSQLFIEADVKTESFDRFAFASRKMPEYMHWQLRQCGRCDLVYADPAPNPEFLSARYQEADFASGTEAGYASRTYARLLRPHLDRLPDRVGALDIGTGDGAFLKELLAAGFRDVVGIEPSAAPVAAAAPEVRPLIRQEVFRPGAFPADSFRLVTCFQTIEHVSDPLELCREALRILKPGGILLLVAHNRRALSAQLLGRRSPIFDVEHLQLFSRESLLHLLQAAGLTEVAIHSFVNRYPLAYWMRLFPLPAALKRNLNRLLSFLLLGRLPVPLPAGNLVAAASKPGM